MPYILKKEKSGFKVCKRDEPSRCFSKEPLTEEQAKKQRTAIILSELRHQGGMDKVKKTIEEDLTLELAEEFFRNPKINPITGANILRFNGVFNRILLKSYSLLPEEEFWDKIKKARISQKKTAELLEETSATLIKSMNEEQCTEFLKDPAHNPITGSETTSILFKRMRAHCEKILHPEEIERAIQAYAKTYIGEDGVQRCANIFEYAYSDPNDTNLIILSHVFPPNLKIDVPQEDPYAKQVLDQCEQKYLMKFYLLRTLLTNTLVNSTAEKSGNQYFIKIHDIRTVVSVIIQYIFNYGRNVEQSQPLIDAIQSIVSDLLDKSTSERSDALFDKKQRPKKIYIEEPYRSDLQSILFELEAIKEGIYIEREDDNSSSTRPSNRDQSLSEPSDLLVFPKKPRKVILRELNRMCTGMRDIISQDRFKKMKKKKLQLVVHIGPKNEAGKQSCYYVKNIYDYVRNELANNRTPKDPTTRHPITQEDMTQVILPKMRYIDVHVIDPFHRKEVNGKVPNIKLEVKNVISLENGRHFYQVGYIRKIGTQEDRSRAIMGYIPANIYTDKEDRPHGMGHQTDVFTDQRDLSSSVLLATLNELNDKGLITDVHGRIRVHINKSMSYWNGTSEQIIYKAHKMMEEFTGLM